MAIGSGSGGGVFAEINITPLTDIFLTNNPKGVTVAYTSEHRIFVNGVSVAQNDLERTIRDALGKTPDKIVVFQGDQKVILGDMVRILDIAKRAGAEQIAIAAQASTPAAGSDTIPR
ncbi:MAG: biopolymer transporter ExbD [Candidatus Binataceae bacterium]